METISAIVQAFFFETGDIRSDLDLGINSKVGDSIIVRKSLTCAPLTSEKYSIDWIEASEVGIPFNNRFSNRVKPYFFGKIGQPFGVPNLTGAANEAVWALGDANYRLW